jgi:hypothetical protein
VLKKSRADTDKLFFDKIVSEIKALSIVCMDDYVRDRLIDLNRKIEEFKEEQGKVNIEEQIANKMEEVRGEDSELNVRLYILYQNLKRKKLSEEEALEIFERYVRQKDFDRMIY